MYSLFITRKSVKFLKTMPNEYGLVIEKYLNQIKSEPRLRGAISLKGLDNCFRIRIGPYRVQYQVDEKKKEVVVFKISRRDETTYE